MRIIEFLMNNIFIVVIILGALASLFGKAGSKKKPGRMPDFGGGGLPRTLFPQASDRESNLDRPLAERTESQPAYRTRPEQERQHSANPALASRDHEAPAGPLQMPALELAIKRAGTGKAKAPDAAERKPDAQSAIAASVQAHDMRKAVMWAEILGPPRSKRPYRK